MVHRKAFNPTPLKSPKALKINQIEASKTFKHGITTTYILGRIHDTNEHLFFTKITCITTLAYPLQNSLFWNTKSEFAFDGPFFNRNYSFTNNSTYIFRIKITFTAKGRCLNFFAKETNVQDFNSLMVRPIIYDYVYNENYLNSTILRSIASRLVLRVLRILYSRMG